MANILTCTDGSLYAQSVYAHAAWAAHKIEGAHIHVLHMLNPHHEEPVKTDYSGSIGFNARAQLLDELVQLEASHAKIAQKRGQAILDDAVLNFKEHKITDLQAEQKHGKLSEEITRYERDASLIVLGKRGNNANFEKGHLGSNLERVIRSCQHPVLVASRSFRPVKHFVLAFDGGTSAQKAVKYAANNSLLSGIKCTLLYIGSGNAKVEASLAQAQSQLRSAGYDVCIEQRAGDPSKVISKIVEQDHIDLIVMGAYGHSQIRHLIVGSTTTEMIRTVRIPVLLFR